MLFSANLDRGTLAGVAITWLSISLLLAAYGYLPVQAKRLSFFIGRNTLVILLFSPIFTILSKAFLPVFAFDPTGMLFLVTATAFTLSGCMGMAWAMDKMHVSRFFFGRGLYCAETVHVFAHKGKFHHKLLFVLKNLHQRAV